MGGKGNAKVRKVGEQGTGSGSGFDPPVPPPVLN